MKIKELFKDTLLLFKVFLRSIRFWGPFTYTLSIVFPCLLLFFLIMNLGPLAQERLPYLISGSLLAGVISISVTSLGQYLVQLRLSGGFEIFRTLPIQGFSLVVGIVLYYLALQLPVFIIFFIIMPFLGIVNFLNVYFFLSIIISIFSLIPIGAFIGLYSKRYEQGTVLSVALSFLMYMCAPVYFPLEQMPQPLQLMAKFIPTTYLANNLRTSMLGQVEVSQYLLNFLIILPLVILLYVLMGKRLKLVTDE
ncbi:hypothetical protein PW5551_10160 [Petrotoga sp. 9PW.55.5.1]|uniref:ABC transporter permease n=1 Tax=Petrotoga sp. 9PW.55.5.1 TaxID=1308979 RepID=UPI000DC454FC|nr:ABC transporter permease [Petrotoga sp. 9PW.55.5.1]RAO98383.1 hypothetical protein PW5551_10160 [Petrotoga sp. 9PW.55.5.1]